MKVLELATAERKRERERPHSDSVGYVTKVRRGGSSGSADASQHSDERKLRRAPKVSTFSPQDPRQRLPNTRPIAGKTLAEQKPGDWLADLSEI